MADRVAVLSAGKVLQVGTPVELYDRPVNHFVAAFIGKTNFLRGVVAPDGIEVPVARRHPRPSIRTRDRHRGLLGDPPRGGPSP